MLRFFSISFSNLWHILVVGCCMKQVAEEYSVRVRIRTGPDDGDVGALAPPATAAIQLSRPPSRLSHQPISSCRQE
jgi:hypothetical protein